MVIVSVSSELKIVLHAYSKQQHFICFLEKIDGKYIKYMFWQNTLEVAENLIKQHEAFITTTDANDEKINAVLQFANRLIEDNHYAADKIHKKAENINERWDSSILYILYIKKDDLLDIVCMNKPFSHICVKVLMTKMVSLS